MTEDGITIERQLPLVGPASHKICFISARQSGLVSLVLQTAVLLLSATLAIFLTIYVDERNLSEAPENQSATNDLRTAASRDYERDHQAQTEKLLLLNDDTENSTYENSTEIYDELKILTNSTTGYSKYNYEADYMDLLHLSTFVYIGMCVIWLISLLSLLASIRLEVIDFVIFNAIVVSVVMIYIVIHALFIAIPFFYLSHLHWKVVTTIVAVMLGLFISSLFCGFALALVVQWYRYIVYVNDNDQCQCLTHIVGFIKDSRAKREVPNDYSIPEATHHSRIPYADDVAIQQFSRF